MDSLFANYASSDDEEHDEQPPQLPRILPPAKPEKLEAKAADDEDKDVLSNSSSKRGGIFNSLPPPKSSLFNSLPPPKSQSVANPKPEGELDRRAEIEPHDENSKPRSSSSSYSLFSSLPPPKSSASSSSSNAKKVVQFRPPTIAYAGRIDEDEDEDEEERQRKRSKASLSTASASSFLSSIPAPKHSATLGALPSASGTGRRSMLETHTPASVTSTVSSEVVNANDGYEKDQSSDAVYDYSSWNSQSENHAYYSGYGSVPDGNVGNHPHQVYDQPNDLSAENYGYYGAYGVGSTAGDEANENPNAGSYEGVDYSHGHDQNVGYTTNYDGSYGDYGNNAQYENNWANVTALPEASGVIESVLQVPGRRGRKDIPPQIVEVKQDELIKNRPREDQVKLTGLAFGPPHQGGGGTSSGKGKPTKLHKRKHQIGSLYFEMKQKEMELAERRAQGFLTKAQTQAKYGW